MKRWTWKPDTCACFAENLGEKFNPTLKVKCRSHNTFQEMRDHNNDSRWNKDTEAHEAKRKLEREKPIYQRR